MKANKYILLGSLLGLTLFSCKNEDPFNMDYQEGSGRILTSDLNLEVRAEEEITRATNVPDVNDFNISFCKTDTPSDAYVSYEYSALPEVVTLPAGEYIVKAFYGDDSVVAAFDSPAYYGESEIVKVENGKIYNIKDPIVCSLYNVRVSVSFDSELKKVMGQDVKVAVKVGESGSLDFTANNTSDGFFKYDDNSTTLAATFSGTVSGSFITEIKNFDNVKRGTFYKVNFKLRNVEVGNNDPNKPDDEEKPNGPNEEPDDPNQDENGAASGSIVVDATVTFHDGSETGENNFNIDQEVYLEDERFPGVGNGNSGNEGPGNNDTPDVPDTPDNPDNSKSLPKLVSDDVNLSTVTDISGWADGQSLAVKILTPTKLKKFICTIDSSTLTPEELESVYLKSRLDLINDTALFEDLSGLGFPVGNDITDPKTMDADGNYVIVFEITQFVKMLNALGEGTHNFIFDLENEAGEVIETLKLKS